MSALLKLAGYLPPFAPGAMALDRLRSRHVDDILRDRAHVVADVQSALQTLRDRNDITAATIVDQHARALLSALRGSTNTSRTSRLAGTIDALVRSERLECMDYDGMPAWAKRLEMELLDKFNRDLGQYAGWTDEVMAALKGVSHARLCDLAAGSGGFYRHVARVGGRDIALELTSTDLETEYVEQGRRAAARDGLRVTFETRDAVRLADLAGRVDLFTCTQATHHLPPGVIVRMIDAATRVAQHGIVVVDVMRGAGFMVGAALGLTVVAPYFPIMLVDGVQSVRRGHTPAEFDLLARLAGADEVRTRFHKPAHCVLHAKRYRSSAMRT